MGVGNNPATVVICCGIPRGLPSDTLLQWIERSRQAGVCVTWVAELADLPRVSRSAGQKSVALSLDPDWLSSRQLLREAFAELRAAGSQIDAVSARGPLPLEHRDLFVAAGIRTVVVEEFSGPAKGSRRPAPAGWPCRSVVWGLWEVRASAATPASLPERLLPWRSRACVPAGGLAVVYAAASADAGAAHLERLLAWQRRQGRPDGVRGTELATIPSLLAGAQQGATQSVLKAA